MCLLKLHNHRHGNFIYFTHDNMVCFSKIKSHLVNHISAYLYLCVCVKFMCVNKTLLELICLTRGRRLVLFVILLLWAQAPFDSGAESSVINCWLSRRLHMVICGTQSQDLLQPKVVKLWYCGVIRNSTS